MTTTARSIRSGALVLALLFAPGFAEGQDRPYRILISNDDGVHSEGIAALVGELSRFAEVVVVAPAENESGGSHRSVIRVQTTTVSRIEKNGVPFGYGLDASPADAVKFGILQFGRDEPFDLVVSGINDGANVGYVAHTSGTVGAAMEALLHGVPAIAVSQGARGEFEVSARFAGEFVRQYLEQGPTPGVLLQVNVPAGEIRGVRAARMGGLYFRVADLERISDPGPVEQFRARVGGRYGVEPDSDTAAYLDGYITVTPLRIDWTDWQSLDELGEWASELERVVSPSGTGVE